MEIKRRNVPFESVEGLVYAVASRANVLHANSSIMLKRLFLSSFKDPSRIVNVQATGLWWHTNIYLMHRFDRCTSEPLLETSHMSVTSK